MQKEIPTSISEERLIAYFRQESEDTERQEIEEWLAASEQHRKRYRQICRTILWLRWSRKEQFDRRRQSALKRLKRKRLRPFLYRWRYAAAIVAVTVMAGGGLLLRNEWQPSAGHLPEILPVPPKPVSFCLQANRLI